MGKYYKTVDAVSAHFISLTRRACIGKWVELTGFGAAVNFLLWPGQRLSLLFPR